MIHNHTDHSVKSDLRIAFFLNFGFTIAEIIGGLLTNSVAILADALHDFGDSLSLALSWRLEKYAEKAGDEKFSYGYRRFSMLGGLINAVILMAGSFFIISESIKRFNQPQLPHAQGILLFALAGIAINGYAAFRTSRTKNLNARIVSWHLVEDVLGWAAVFLVGLVLLFFDIPFLDPLVSIVVTVFVLVGVSKNFKRTMKLFLQGVPDETNLDEIEKALRQIPNVEDIHHLHAWSLDGENHVLTMHINICAHANADDIKFIKEQIHKLAENHGFIHTTVEVELFDEDCSMGLARIKEVS